MTKCTDVADQTELKQRILDDALRLPKDERVEVARALLLSADSLGDGIDDEGVTFSEKWRGKFEPAERDDERYKALAWKYL